MTDNTSKIDALMEQEENMLNKAIVQTMGAYNQTPTVANLNNWNAAKNALAEHRAKKAAETNPQVLPLKGVPEVLEYLQSEGWKISQSKLYADQGKIDKQKDGAILKKDADKYAKYFLQKLDGSDNETDPAGKQTAETRLTNERADKIAFENDVMRGSYVLKSDVEQQLASRAAYLKNNLSIDFIHGRAAKIAQLLEGNVDKIPDLIDFWIEQIEQVFDHYSKPLTFEAVKVKTEEE